MTAYINKLKDKTGNQQLPVTHERAVRDDNGTTLESKMQNLEGAMDRAYVAGSGNGMGRITLPKNNGVLTPSMMQATNTIYIIQYDFTLGEDITVPENCVLEFDGGSISGAYTLTGNNTGINAGLIKIFNTNVTLAGSWNIIEAYPEWFGAVGDGVADDTNAFLKCVNLGKKVIGTKHYIIDTHAGRYDIGTAPAVNKIILHGGKYNMSGRINFSGDIDIDNVEINGSPWFTGKDFNGRKVEIKNSVFDVEDLTFRLNDTDFDTVVICNNIVSFYGAFWTSSQTDMINSKGSVYIFNNKFKGKEHDHTESYYCSCIVENNYVEFYNNTCDDFISLKSDASVHDGYFGSDNVYVHDNICTNFSGGDTANNAILKAKSLGRRLFFNNIYNFSSDDVFPIIQIQYAGSTWIIKDCIFNINKVHATNVSNSDILFDSCKFNIGYTDVLFYGQAKFTNCDFNIITMAGTAILLSGNSLIDSCNISIDDFSSGVNNYRFISGSDNSVMRNINGEGILLTASFPGIIENCNTIPFYNDRNLGKFFNSRVSGQLHIANKSLKIDLKVKGQSYYFDSNSSDVTDSNVELKVLASTLYIRIKNEESCMLNVFS